MKEMGDSQKTWWEGEVSQIDWKKMPLSCDVTDHPLGLDFFAIRYISSHDTNRSFKCTCMTQLSFLGCDPTTQKLSSILVPKVEIWNISKADRKPGVQSSATKPSLAQTSQSLLRDS